MSDQPDQSERKRPKFIVGIGASAGGLDALERLFSHMPTETGLAFVVVQHLSPDFKSLMDELLSRHTSMKIHRVSDAMPVEPNGVYLIPPKKNMIISEGKLLLTEQSGGGLNLPIDIFLSSLAKEQGVHGIAVVLSGTGSDGSRGIQDVHHAGGLVFTQNLDSAEFDGMPRNAISTGCVDVVTYPERMPEMILHYVANPSKFSPDDFAEISDAEDPENIGSLFRLFRIFRRQYRLDFSSYKAPTINRRLARRMQMVKARDLDDYLELLEASPTELDALYRDLLVEVTYFFRDPEAFQKLWSQVLPNLLDDKTSRDQVRVWVSGCATGEEAYSVAMLIHKYLEERHLSPNVKIFATDVHKKSLEIASTGVYSATSVSKMPEDVKERYLTQNGELYHIAQELRQLVIFASHDITNDPPFTKLDLLCCRNVLIYFRPEVQKRVLSMFHFGLKTDGALFLGPSETLGDLGREFETIDKHWKLFRKMRDVRLTESVGTTLPAPLKKIVRQRPQAVAEVSKGDDSWLIPETYEDLLSRYVPPSLLVNEYHELLHSFGDARRYLVQPEGKPTLDVLKMVEGNLRNALSTALHRAAREKETTVFQGIRVELPEGPRQIRLLVEPYMKRKRQMFLICMETAELSEEDDSDVVNFESGPASNARVEELERELSYTKETLQTTVEELEASNEELQSTNEELVASNEELQSMNEELHSVNEELYTVNAEHQQKIDELTELSSDVDNLLRSIEIGTVFLDEELRIRKFTPSISVAFNIIEQDIGRPIEHISHTLNAPTLREDMHEVLRSGESLERQVTDRKGNPYLQRIRPYKSSDDSQKGVVLIFVDVSSLLASEKLAKSDDSSENAAHSDKPGQNAD